MGNVEGRSLKKAYCLDISGFFWEALNLAAVGLWGEISSITQDSSCRQNINWNSGLPYMYTLIQNWELHLEIIWSNQNDICTVPAVIIPIGEWDNKLLLVVPEGDDVDDIGEKVVVFTVIYFYKSHSENRQFKTSNIKKVNQ